MENSPDRPPSPPSPSPDTNAPLLRPRSQPLVSSPLNPNRSPSDSEHTAASSEESSGNSSSPSGNSSLPSGSGSGPSPAPPTSAPPQSFSQVPPSSPSLGQLHSPASGAGFDPSLYTSSRPFAGHSRYSSASPTISGLAELPDDDNLAAREPALPPGAGPPSSRASYASTAGKESIRHSMAQSSSIGPLLWDEKNVEPDDYLHEPGPQDIETPRRHFDFFAPARAFVGIPSPKGILNVFSLVLLLVALVGLFAGWPISYHFTHSRGDYFGYNMAGANSTGQIPDIPNFPGLIDEDTPESARTWTNLDGESYSLVFSDEFNVDGRTFWEGDDPWWEAVDLHYWGTTNLEWYDPDAAVTRDGNLELVLTEQPIHGLNFRGGMVTTWNKMCFTGGYVEVNVSLPGTPDAQGFWPAAWLMGNLGRAGYGATADGTWPYSYDSCDVGTIEGQIFPNGTPAAAADSGSSDYGGQLSRLPGQKLSACTCPGDDHPGPSNDVGRSAPEIDILEAQVSGGQGTASQSLQIAPFDDAYDWDNTTSAGLDINNPETILNPWKGSITQESCSAVTPYGTTPYDGAGYVTFSFDWKPGRDDGYVAWYVDNEPSWTLKAGAFGPNEASGVGQRLISEEPMYILLNLGISTKFQEVQFDRITFPATYRVDYVRVYQPDGQRNVGCDPESYPTTEYINNHLAAYDNPNATIWSEANFTWPRNSLIDTC